MNEREFYESVVSNPPTEYIKDHLLTLYKIVVALNAKSVIELGVQTGQSSSAFLYALVHTNGKLWSVDIDPLGSPGKEFLPNTSYWTFTQANDLDVVDKAPMADIIFIDTSHLFEHTIKELTLYENHLNNGGVFILHDTHNLDCIGVPIAIGYFMSRYPDYRLYNFEFNYGLGVLGKDLSKLTRLLTGKGSMYG